MSVAWLFVESEGEAGSICFMQFPISALLALDEISAAMRPMLNQSQRN
jgi:hypothetical protein